MDKQSAQRLEQKARELVARLRADERTKETVRIVLLQLMAENARLAAEINDHRQARGYERLQVMD